MTRREILEVRREIWRGAALRDQRQFHLRRGDSEDTESGVTGDPECAFTILPQSLYDDHSCELLFRCPEHTGEYDVRHWNNHPHAWDWLTLATKLGTEPYSLVEPEKGAPQ